MKKLFILLLLSFITFTGCDKDDDPTKQQTTPQTFVKEESEIVSVSNNSIILTGTQSDIEENDIIVSGANNNAPKGFLRKVTSKTSSNGNTILQTQSTTISEAVKYFYEEDEEYEGGINYTFQPSDQTGRNVSQNASMPITITIDETVTTTDGGIPIEVNLTGSLTITPNITFDIKISNRVFSPAIEEFNFAITTENDFNISLNTEVNASFDTNDIELGSFTSAPITITVGIPIVIIPKFTLYIGANGDLNASILYTYNNHSTAKSGVTYNNGWEYLPDNGFSINNQSATATASVSGNLKAYVKPEFSLSLYDEGFVSSGISVEPYARFDGDVSSTEYSWSINGGIDTGAFFKAQAFGFSLVDEEWSDLINIQEWEIASGGYNIATITNPIPTDNSTITEQPVVFSWQPNNFTETPTYEVLLGSESNSLNILGTTNNTNFTYSNTLNNGTYYWKVIARDSNNDIITESLIFSFILNQNTTTDPVHTPIPNNGAIDINLNGNLSFSESTNTPSDATFKVYFEANPNPTTVYNLGANTNTLNYNGLQEGTQYYWKVETISNTGSVLATSPIWSFTTLSNTANTEPVFNPTPNNGATNVLTNGNLSFTAGANTPTDATYKLYFDTNSNPTTQYNLGTQTTHGYSGLQENTTYYWKVETVSNAGSVLATSNVWNFITENNTSGGIYNGNVTLATQQEIDDFGANNYSEITGNLLIGGDYANLTDITNLSSLNSITSVGGYLAIIWNPNLLNLNGLNSITYVGSNFDLTSNDSLNNTDGLSSIAFVGGMVSLGYCNSLTNIDGLSSLQTIQSHLNIRQSDLINLDGLSSLQYIGGDLSIGYNQHVDGNHSLTNLNGLNALTNVGGDLRITYSTHLTNLCGITNLITNGVVSGSYIVYLNSYNPTQQDIIDGNCSQ
ncbi:hypothetical protein [Xanthomarina gelatinilytica]|uniref:hypothetical protein n=1 Tax=Xanthomarina gelatinilytica TaxID=1137281 RepID=UPI003AA7EEEB